MSHPSYATLIQRKVEATTEALVAVGDDSAQVKEILEQLVNDLIEILVPQEVH